MPKSHEPTNKRVQFSYKTYMVPLRAMRRPDFLQKEFRESRARVMAGDNLDLNALGNLVVNHRDGIFWIIDGCHRQWALVESGFADYEVSCEVYENLSDAEMAQVFLLRAKRRVMGMFETFKVRCDADSSRESEIQRVVEANRLKISREHEPHCISAVAALGRVYDGGGSKVLGQTVRALRDGFGGDPMAFDGQMIRAMGMVFNRHNGHVDEQLLVERLSQVQHGARGLMRRAEAQRERTGNQKAQCLAAVIVDAVNKGTAPSKRLPSWWKETATN